MKLSHRNSQLALCLALGLFARGALAQETRSATSAQSPVDSVNMEVIVLHGTNDGTGIDPKIGKMPELGKPPFSSFNSYKLLERPKISVQKGKAGNVKLPSGRDVTVTLKDILAPKKKDEVTRYAVSMSIQKPDGNTFLPLLDVSAKAGEWSFVSGQTYKGGTLVIGVKVLP